MCVRSMATSSGGIGTTRVSFLARHFRPRSCRYFPSSVHASPACGSDTDRMSLPHPSPDRSQSCSHSATASDGRSAAKLQQSEERHQVRPPRPADVANGGQQFADLVSRGDHAAVNRLGDLRGRPLHAVDRICRKKAELDRVAERVVEHRPLTAGGGRSGRTTVDRLRTRVMAAAQAPPQAARSGTPYGRAAWAPVPPAVPIGRPTER